MRIPRRHRGEHLPLHPSTISPLTQSVGFAINGGTSQIFNATPASSNCVAGSGGTTCTFAVGAPPGADTFVVSTYAGINGTGGILDQATAALNVVPGKNNSFQITLGPVVSTNADSGAGSLRFAVGSANAGDTITFILPAGSNTVTLTSGPIKINTSVTIAGPGFTTSAREHRHRRGVTSHTTFSGTTINGGGKLQLFVIAQGTTATISGLVLSDGYASVTNPSNMPGGAVYNLGNLTLASDAITGNTSAITNVRHTVRSEREKPRPPHVRNGVTIPQGPRHHPAFHPDTCTASAQYGGGVYNNGVLTVTGTTFDSNVLSNTCGGQSYGGAIYNDTYGTMTIGTSTFSNNAAAIGGAVYNDGTYGQANFTSDAFTGNYGCTASNGCPTGGCSVGGGCSNYAYGYGGAIYDNNGPGVSVANSTFTNNSGGGNTQDSYGEGGAVYLGTGAPLITGSTFTGNSAGGGTNCSYGDGGAVYESAGSPIQLDNDTFTNNQASGDESSEGGAVYSNSNRVLASNDTFTGNSVTSTSSPCELYPYPEGGAIFAGSGINLTGGTLTNNATTSAYEIDGGTIYIGGNSTIAGSTFSGNMATTTALSGGDGYIYGGVIENRSPLKLTNNTFTSNVSTAGLPTGYQIEGGIDYIDNGYSLTSSGNTFQSNTTSAPWADNGEIYGSVISVGDYYNGGTGSTFTSSGDTFKSNTSTAGYEVEGVAINVGGKSALHVNGDTFTSNSASAPYAYAGAISDVGCCSGNSITVAVANSTFTGNAAGTGADDGYGGAVALFNDTSTTGPQIVGSTFTGNTATLGGGAVADYSQHGVSIASSTFSANMVSGAQSYYGGGAIDASTNCCSSPVTQITDSTFIGNSVTPVQFPAGGGAILNDDQYGGNVTVTGSTFSANTVLGNLAGTGGGAILQISGGAIINSTFTGNTSNEDGGGIENYNNNETTALANDTLVGNKATGNGGNIEVANSSTLDLANTIVAGGTSGTGGADIDNGGTTTSLDYNLVQSTPDPNASPSPNPIVTPNPDHDIWGQNPLLAGLANNGGPTQTMADGSSSPGTAYVPFSGNICGNAGTTATGVDQRGYTRGAGSKCDIGAYEFNGVASAVKRPLPHLKLPPSKAHNHPLSRTWLPKHRNPLELHRSSHEGAR